MTRRLAFVIGLLTVLGESHLFLTCQNFGKSCHNRSTFHRIFSALVFLPLGGRKVEIIDDVPQEKLSVREGGGGGHHPGADCRHFTPMTALL